MKNITISVKIDKSKHGCEYCKKIYKNNKSGYKGVYECFTPSKKGMWKALITKNYVSHKLGYFTTKEEAALAYNKAAVELHGEFARLNVIV